MIKRRDFLLLGSLFGLSRYVKANDVDIFLQPFKKVEATIAAVQEHMFPKGSALPDAKSVQATKFLYETITHKSYDKDIRTFVFEGAQELQNREKKHFVSMSNEEKEKALRSYEKTNYGSAWIERIMTLTMEGMFSSPIYGCNIKEIGWKSVHSYGGYPRAKTRYMES